jgi:hypothetical protein
MKTKLTRILLEIKQCKEYLRSMDIIIFDSKLPKNKIEQASQPESLCSATIIRIYRPVLRRKCRPGSQRKSLRPRFCCWIQCGCG